MKVGLGFSRMEQMGHEGWLIFVLYDPSGNFNDDFENNVLPLKSAGECPPEPEKVEDSLKGAILVAHEMANLFRSQHCDTPLLEIDSDLLDSAMFVVKKHGDEGIWAHSAPEDRFG